MSTQTETQEARSVVISQEDYTDPHLKYQETIPFSQDTISVKELINNPLTLLRKMYPFLEGTTEIEFRYNTFANRVRKRPSTEFVAMPLMVAGTNKVFTGQQDFSEKTLAMLPYRVPKNKFFTLELSRVYDLTASENVSLIWNLVWLLRHPQVAISEDEVHGEKSEEYTCYLYVPLKASGTRIEKVTKEIEFKKVVLEQTEDTYEKLVLCCEYLGLTGIQKQPLVVLKDVLLTAADANKDYYTSFIDIWTSEKHTAMRYVKKAISLGVVFFSPTVYSYVFDGRSLGGNFKEVVDNIYKSPTEVIAALKKEVDLKARA